MTMLRRTCLLVLLTVLVALPAGAVTVSTPTGPSEVFSRGDLVDLVELLRLTGAQVGFSPAAGSYTAQLGDHEVQFTPGGSLAVIDGALAPLPGPIRVLEGHVVGTLTTAAVMLTPLGWTARPGASGIDLVQATVARQVTIEVVQSPTGPLVVLRGIAEAPRVDTAEDLVTLSFPAPVTVAQPVPLQDGLVGADGQGNVIRLHLAPGVAVMASYPLASPPRFVLRLGTPAVATAATQRRTGPLVVLDPGHGGEDDGAHGPGSELEKTIALAVARLTAAQLQARGITTRLTRTDDETLPLTERTAIANRLHADVFVSIHVNASPARGARGAETYFMSADASDAQAEQAAARENVNSGSDPVKLILWDLAYTANLSASSRLAMDIQDRLNSLQDIRDRGVKQAPFAVLTGALMPAALVEVGFLSNPEEAVRLTSPDTQQQLAAALADAIVTYLNTPAPAGVTPTP